jgi:5-methylcytosine-specific restriction endonuclease McrA
MANRAVTRLRSCLQCGQTPISGYKFCSTKCRGERQRLGQGIRRLADSACRQTHICENCQTPYQPKRAGRVRFCSRECAFAFKTAHARGRQPRPEPLRVCTSCGVSVGPKCRVCAACRKPGYVPRPKLEVACRDCGSLVVGTASKVRCGSCARKRDRVYAKQSGSRAAHRRARKLRQRGARVEPVNLLHVLERDGWRCQLCGISTPRRLRGSFDDRAPEVDHIIPIASGGEHSYRNTQCACRKCNIAKSSKPQGQMRLFG